MDHEIAHDRPLPLIAISQATETDLLEMTIITNLEQSHREIEKIVDERHHQQLPTLIDMFPDKTLESQ
jgi:hypothetical protein